MRTFACVFIIAILIVACYTETDARVIAGNLDNAVAVYYFTSLTNSGNVQDYSGKGLHGSLYDGAQLSRVSGRNGLSLSSNAAAFVAYDNHTSISVQREFSIVGWVKIPRQTNEFYISMIAYNGLILDINRLWEADLDEVAEGSVYIGIGSDNTLYGAYVYNNNENWVAITETSAGVNNNTWKHVGLVVSSSSMKLYVNGQQVATESIAGHRSIVGSGTAIFIGEDARGSVDNVGLFKKDLTDAQVELIYNQGLANVISIAPVEPGGKVATTWGALKHR